MISRRNIRTKIFQTIYELERQDIQLTEELAIKYFAKKLEETSSLLASVYHLAYLISDYVLIYSNQKSSKRLPTHEDLNINTKLAGNTIIQQLKKNDTFSEVLKRNSLGNQFDEELIKRLFLTLIETPEYIKYIGTQERSNADEKNIISFIIKEMIYHNEYSMSFFDENFINWSLDCEMLESWHEKIIASASKFNFSHILSNEKREFANELLATYIQKKSSVFELIEPKLVNWDADRVALIDLILLHLGICEFLYFPTIPVKVTINEYIDLTKTFSTLQSGQFVNGLLDNVRKELTEKNLIIKEDFRAK